MKSPSGKHRRVGEQLPSPPSSDAFFLFPSDTFIDTSSEGHQNDLYSELSNSHAKSSSSFPHTDASNNKQSKQTNSEHRVNSGDSSSTGNDSCHSRSSTKCAKKTYIDKRPVTKNTLIEALSLNLTQQQAATNFFGLSLSTLKRRLRGMGFKWPRGKREREDILRLRSGSSLDAAHVEQQPTEIQENHSTSVHQSNHQISIFSSNHTDKISSTNNHANLSTGLSSEGQLNQYSPHVTQYSLSFNSRLEQVINSCQAFLQEANHIHPSSNSSMEQTMSGTPSRAFIETLQARNKRLESEVFQQKRILEELKRMREEGSHAFQAWCHTNNIPQSLEVRYRGDISSVSGPWHNIKRSLSEWVFVENNNINCPEMPLLSMPNVGVCVLDKNLNLISSNHQWDYMMGYSKSDYFSQKNSTFSTYHHLWPRMMEYSDVLASLQPYMFSVKDNPNDESVRQIRTIGIFKRKDGRYVIVSSIFNIFADYFVEALVIEPKQAFSREVIFESGSGKLIKKVTKDVVVQNQPEHCDDEEFLVETFMTFKEVVQMSRVIS